MKLSINAFAAVSALLWGGAILCAAIARGLWPSYGQAFLDLIASVYPGLSRTAGAARTAVGTAYGLIDGAVAGSLLAWLYNRFAP